jgi:hypothetical protein
VPATARPRRRRGESKPPGAGRSRNPPNSPAARFPRARPIRFRSVPSGGDADHAAEGRGGAARGRGAQQAGAGGRGLRARRAAGGLRALRQRAHRRLAAEARRRPEGVRQARLRRRRRLQRREGECCPPATAPGPSTFSGSVGR